MFVWKKLEKKKYYVSVCSIFKNEAKYLEEWLNYHLVVGVEHFYLYNNFSEDNYKKVLKPYIEKGLVTLIEWPIKAGQTQAYNDCVEKFSDESNWIGFIDLDEFAVPVKYDQVSEWLKKYEKFPCVLGFYRDFGSSGIVEENDSKLICEQFTMCTDFVSPSMFLNTSWSNKIKAFNVAHFARFKFFNKVCPENMAFFVGIAKTIKNPDFQFNHYYCKSLEYFVNKKIPGGDVYKVSNNYSLERFFRVEKIAVYENKQIFKYLTRLKTFGGLK